MIDKMLYIPLGSQFGETVSGYYWEIIVKCCILLAEYYQQQPFIHNIVKKYKQIISKIRFPLDAFSYEGKIMPATPDSVNTSVFKDS